MNLDKNKRAHEPTEQKIKYTQSFERFEPFDRDDDVYRLLFFFFCIHLTDRQRVPISDTFTNAHRHSTADLFSTYDDMHRFCSVVYDVSESIDHNENDSIRIQYSTEQIRWRKNRRRRSSQTAEMTKRMLGCNSSCDISRHNENV